MSYGRMLNMMFYGQMLNMMSYGQMLGKNGWGKIVHGLVRCRWNRCDNWNRGSATHKLSVTTPRFKVHWSQISVRHVQQKIKEFKRNSKWYTISQISRQNEVQAIPLTSSWETTLPLENQLYSLMPIMLETVGQHSHGTVDRMCTRPKLN